MSSLEDIVGRFEATMATVRYGELRNNYVLRALASPEQSELFGLLDRHGFDWRVEGEILCLRRCFGKKVFTKITDRVKAAREGKKEDEPVSPVWLAPHEEQFCNKSGAVQVQQHRVTGARRTVFSGCTYPACNCDHIEKWYAKDYQDE